MFANPRHIDEGQPRGTKILIDGAETLVGAACRQRFSCIADRAVVVAGVPGQTTNLRRPRSRSLMADCRNASVVVVGTTESVLGRGRTRGRRTESRTHRSAQRESGEAEEQDEGGAVPTQASHVPSIARIGTGPRVSPLAKRMAQRILPAPVVVTAPRSRRQPIHGMREAASFHSRRELLRSAAGVHNPDSGCSVHVSRRTR